MRPTGIVKSSSAQVLVTTTDEAGASALREAMAFEVDGLEQDRDEDVAPSTVDLNSEVLPSL